MKRLPTPYEQNKLKIIGKNKSTFDVVSNMMTAREYVIRVDPDKTAAAPMIA